MGDSSEPSSVEIAQSVDVQDGGLRPSKSDTSLTDSFVVLSAPASPAPATTPTPAAPRGVIKETSYPGIYYDVKYS